MDYVSYYVKSSRKKRARSHLLLFAVAFILSFYAISSAGISAFFPKTISSAEELAHYAESTSNRYRPFVRVSLDTTLPVGVYSTGEASKTPTAVFATVGIFDNEWLLIASPADRPLPPLDGTETLLLRRSDVSYAQVLFENQPLLFQDIEDKFDLDRNALLSRFSDVGYYYDAGFVSHSGSIALFVFGVGLLLGCLIRVCVILLSPVRSDPFVKSLAALGPYEELAAKLNREMTEPVITTEESDVTDTFVIGSQSLRHDIDFAADLVFAYIEKTPRRERPPGGAMPYAVTCHFMDGKRFYLLAPNELIADELRKALISRAPHALFDDTDELREQWYEDRAALIRRVKALRDGVDAL